MAIEDMSAKKEAGGKDASGGEQSPFAIEEFRNTHSRIGLAVPVARTRKRGLTVSAPSADDAKKSKVAPPPIPSMPPLPKPQNVDTNVASSQPSASKASTAPEPTLPAPNAETDSKPLVDETFVDKASARSGGQKPAKHKLSGNGPHTFLVSAPILRKILDASAENGAFMVLKSTMLEVAEKSVGLEKEEVAEVVWDLVDESGLWEMYVRSEEAAKSEEAKSLCQRWSKIQDEMKDVDKKWYCEVTVQKPKPSKGVPAMEIVWDMFLYALPDDLFHRGSWWITDVVLADDQSAKAAELLYENVPTYYLV